MDNNTLDIPGHLFRQFAMDLYQKNLLIKNQMMIEKPAEEANADGIAINLKHISVHLSNIIGNKDDLVSPASSIPISEAISSNDKKTIEFPSGYRTTY
ncbi:MAG: hypothetical protein M3162_04470 [Thermoproteota archaeon]|nr:hypothetical protein [Thermoproteota archaeon]